MSEFFQNFDEEEKKPQKKNIVSFDEESESQEKISNKERKLNELHDEINKLENDLTIKKLDTFIKNSKKYKTIFKSGVPSFVKDFFEGIVESKKTNQNIKNKVIKFLAPYKTEKTVEINESILKDEHHLTQDNAELILNEKVIAINNLEDIKAQEKELNDLVDVKNTAGMNFKIYFSLFNNYLKNRESDFNTIIKTFMKICELSRQEPEFLDIDFRPLLVDNIAHYLNYIASIVTEKDYNDFENKLNSMKDINEDAVNKIILEFHFLMLNKNIETDDKLFKLLNLTRNGDYEIAKSYYELNNIFQNNDRATNAILNEFGILAFNNDELLFAFKLLQQCFLNSFYDGEIYLYIISILIEEQIIDEPFFDIFLDTFLSLDDNPFLCKSEDKKREIQRAYFYFKNYDTETASNILTNVVPGFNYKALLDARIHVC